MAANADRVRRILRAQREEAEARARAFAEEKRAKAEDAALGVLMAVANPEVQRHFVTMGLEFMMGLDAMMREMPMPGPVRKAADLAEAARSQMADAYCDANPGCRAKKKERLEKIELDRDGRR